MFNVNKRVDEYNNTLLHVAVGYNDILLVNMLLLKGADPNLYNLYGICPLSIAETLNLDEISNSLIKYGALSKSSIKNISVPSTNSSVFYNNANISNAAYVNHSKFIPFLLENQMKNLSVDCSDSYKNTSLMKASFKNNTNLVATCLNYNSDIFLKDRLGYDAFMWAAFNGNFDSFRLLFNSIKSGDTKEYINKVQGIVEYECTLMLAAVYSSSTELVQFLLENGAIVNYTPEVYKNLKSPIYLSLYQGNITITKLLLNYGAIFPVTFDKWIFKFLCMHEKIVNQTLPNDPFSFSSGFSSNSSVGSPITPLSDKKLKKPSFTAPQPKPVSSSASSSTVGSPTSANSSDQNNYKSVEKYLYIVPPKLPNGKPAQMSLNVFKDINLFEDVSLSKNKESIFSSDKLNELIRSIWFTRIVSKTSFEYNKNHSNIEFQSVVKQKLNLNNMELNQEEFKTLLNNFNDRGSQLDLLLMYICKSLIQLIIVSQRNLHTQYVALAGKAIQETGELVRIIEHGVLSDKKSKLTMNEMGKNIDVNFIGSWIQGSLLGNRLKDLVKLLRNEDVKTMLLSARLAVGAWPPPNAVPTMITSAIKLVESCKRLVSLANCSGFYLKYLLNFDFLINYSGEIEISDIFVDESNNGEHSMTFAAYHREQQQQLLNQLSSFPIQSDNSSNNSTMISIVTPATNSLPENESPDPTDIDFHSVVENAVRQFVYSVSVLKTSVSNDAKDDYLSNSTAIYLRIESIIDEFNEYYLFKNQEADVIIENIPIDGRILSLKKGKQLLVNTLNEAAEQLIVKSKLASGVWPPPGAADEMMKIVVNCVKLVKIFCAYMWSGATALRLTENEERKKLEQFKTDWVRNAQVRELFTRWEKIQMEENTSTDYEKSKKLNQLSPEDQILIADSTDGLSIEQKDGKSFIRGGKLFKLVEKLTDHNSAGDSEFINAFLLNFHSFTSTSELLELLQKRYQISPKYGLTQHEFEVYVHRKVVPIRLRVFNVIKEWVKKYPEDFSENKKATESCITFIQTKVVKDFGDFSLQLVDTLKKIMEIDTEKIKQTQQSTVQKIANFPAKTLNSFLSSVLEMDAGEIARQIALIDIDLYKRIRPKECLKQAWEKTDKLDKSFNITKMIKFTNDVTRWIAQTIVSCEDVKQRIQAIKIFINVASQCRDLNNFNGLTAVTAGLTMGPVHRMTKMWTIIKEKHGKMMETLNQLSEVVSPKGQYKDYRKVLKNSTLPCVPFLGVYLTDLTFIELGNPDYLPDTNYINFEKRRKVSLIVSEIQQYQDPANYYKHSEVPLIMSFIKSLGSVNWLNESQLYEISHANEPQEIEDE